MNNETLNQKVEPKGTFEPWFFVNMADTCQLWSGKWKTLIGEIYGTSDANAQRITDCVNFLRDLKWKFQPADKGGTLKSYFEMMIDLAKFRISQDEVYEIFNNELTQALGIVLTRKDEPGTRPDLEKRFSTACNFSQWELYGEHDFKAVMGSVTDLGLQSALKALTYCRGESVYVARAFFEAWHEGEGFPVLTEDEE